ncbi:hypothetical protein D7319_14480 [Streptomyces radicis]|uniref:Uncharacterized protein n=1 Tax=Streptomyces radicis TaxID=1750517 RepID=A0A3A9W5X0_9ACTN|nr:hypothetical protein D7319_14480 [Streptomyces radicis]RKN21759.1 hypothetical protein D7318_15435 [Streptomyces radicis]
MAPLCATTTPTLPLKVSWASAPISMAAMVSMLSMTSVSRSGACGSWLLVVMKTDSPALSVMGRSPA